MALVFGGVHNQENALWVHIVQVPTSKCLHTHSL